MGIAMKIIIIVMISFMAQSAAAENYVGIILDGYKENCKIKSKGEEYDCASNSRSNFNLLKIHKLIIQRFADSYYGQVNQLIDNMT